MGPKADKRVSSACAHMATSSLEAIPVYHNSVLRQHTERHPTVTYIPGSILAMSPVILAKKRGQASTREGHSNKRTGVEYAS